MHLAEHAALMGVFQARLDAIQELLGAKDEAADHHNTESAGVGVNFLLN